MLLEPIYGENIIVAVVYNKVWQWYITEKDLWFLDYNKLQRAYVDEGFYIEDIIEENERDGIKVLDSQTLDEFLERISKYSISRGELNSMLKSKVKSKGAFDDLLDFSPNILVDFDNKRFYSMFPEPASFEDYVPKEWVGEYLDFTSLIPDEQKYWLSELNENIFLKY